MARVFTLQSGSNGNCTFVGDAESGILVDIGLSFSRAKAGLEEAKMSLEQIEALLITHEHIDHIKGLEVFCKKTDIPVYATEKTAEKLIFHAPSVEKNLHIIEKGREYCLGRTSFTAFEVYHDSADAVGYRITTADNRKVVYSTDAGHIDDALFKNLCGADFNIIEANYDSGMLMCNAAYPFLLRQRISGGCGHISNDDCAKTVAELVKGGNRRFLLAHLSEQNNTPEVAFESVKLALDCAGFEFGVDYELEVAPRYENSRMLIF
ncbi:MAG: MBL fold metallo-hydrolase [Oscillospiraceae bacterium]|nr:MBL fold metallo-hydrolase [Oscillospiraceae bacterium]